MNIYNKSNTQKTAEGVGLESFLLIGRCNVKNTSISVQISKISVGFHQPVHYHQPEQCYYIIGGKGLITIADEQQEVNEGDTIYIPSNEIHGIKNIGDSYLEYLTANAPAFNMEYENSLWPVVDGSNFIL
jgi:mannose-6-phosphate isomerase-like protein (cupin superfamily)